MPIARPVTSTYRLQMRGDRFTFADRVHSFEDVSVIPKPHQAGGVPLHMAAWTPGGLRLDTAVPRAVVQWPSRVLRRTELIDTGPSTPPGQVLPARGRGWLPAGRQEQRLIPVHRGPHDGVGKA